MIHRSLLLLALLGLNLKGSSQDRYSIIISEIMADPSPPAQLPPYEYIEVYNCSNDTINLYGWKLGAGSEVTMIRENTSIDPGGYLVLCRASSVDYFKDLGNCLGITSFPSINNEGEIIYIRSPQDKISHAVGFSSGWHSNELKKNGGWSLEMIDLESPCVPASNWTSSIDPKGGTPGKPNSVNNSVKDIAAPYFAYAFMLDSVHLLIEFNEPVDSLKASQSENIWIDDVPLRSTSIHVQAPLFDKCLVTLLDPVRPGAIFPVSGKNITDCSGNLIDPVNKIMTGLAMPPLASDLVINEIMFNPSSIGKDYIEIFNRSMKPIDLRKLFIATVNIAGNLSGHTPITGQLRIILPGEYIVACADTVPINIEFGFTEGRKLYELKEIPSMPDDKGTIVLTDEQGNIIDKVMYSKDWHLPFISNQDGLSLERIDPAGESNDPNNWSSASTLIKGTPGYRNSQSGDLSSTMKGNMWVERKVFSPDGDGHEDLMILHYNFSSPGTMVSIRVYNSTGQLVSYPVNNALIGVSGILKWDGSSTNNTKLPVGIYLVQATCINENGKRYKFTQAVTLAGKVY